MDQSEAYHKKMVGEKVWLLIIKLGIPTTITMLISNIYNLVDTYYVGTLGTSQQGATGILFTLQAILQAFAFLLGHGAGTHVARKLAERDRDGASTYAASAFSLGSLAGAILLIFGLIFLEPLCLALGSSSTILPYAKEYAMWLLISGPFLITSLILNNILRYEGKAVFAMIGLVSGAMLNIFGDFVFITLCDLGVFGAGMSTAISQIIAFFLLLFFFLRKAQTSLHPRHLRWQRSIYADIFVSGFPSLIRQGLASISGGVLNNVAGPFGDAAIAAMSVVNRYANFVMCVGLGVGQGFQPVAAYNYTIKEYSRVRRGCWFTLAFTTIVITLLSVVCFIIPEKIVTLFNPDPEVVRLGTIALRHSAWSLIIMPVSVIANMTFQSIRKSWTATFLSSLRNGLVFIPLIFLLVNAMSLGFDGVALAQPLSDLIASAISAAFLIVFMVNLHRLERQRENAPKENEIYPN